jgi:hypothetical protein
MGEITLGSEWVPEFMLGGEWVAVEFHEYGASMRVDGEELRVPFDGEWHEGKLLGVLVRGRLH